MLCFGWPSSFEGDVNVNSLWMDRTKRYQKSSLSRQLQRAKGR